MAARRSRGRARWCVAAIVVAAGTWFATRSPDAERPVATSDGAATAESGGEAPRVPGLRVTRRSVAATSGVGDAPEEWFVLRGRNRVPIDVRSIDLQPTEPMLRAVAPRIDSGWFENGGHAKAEPSVEGVALAFPEPEAKPGLLPAVRVVLASVASTDGTLRLEGEVQAARFLIAAVEENQVPSVRVSVEALRALETRVIPWETTDGGKQWRLALPLVERPSDGLERRTFDVRDLGVRAPDDAEEDGAEAKPRISPVPLFSDQALAEKVRAEVEPDSWRAPGASARVEDGTLVARNTPAALDTVGVWLAGLRERLRPQVEARAREFDRTHRAFEVDDLVTDDPADGTGRLAPEGLRAVVTSRVDPASWCGTGRIEVTGGLLVVRNSPENLEEVARLLDRLREALHLARGTPGGGAVEGAR